MVCSRRAPRLFVRSPDEGDELTPPTIVRSSVMACETINECTPVKTPSKGRRVCEFHAAGGSRVLPCSDGAVVYYPRPAKSFKEAVKHYEAFLITSALIRAEGSVCDACTEFLHTTHQVLATMLERRHVGLAHLRKKKKLRPGGKGRPGTGGRPRKLIQHSLTAQVN